MKRLLTLLLATITVFVFASCTGGTSRTNNDPSDDGGNGIVNVPDDAEQGSTVTDTVNANEDGFTNTRWYGWWMVTDTTGEYDEYDGYYFDCCANIEPTDEGYLLMSVWDEVFPSYEDNCVGELYFEEYDEGLLSVGGYFYTGESVGEDGEIAIIPEISGVENTLFTTVDVEDETGSFVATLFLTKWGTEWNEEFGEYPTYYDSYFLPLMEEGEGLPADISDIG